MKQIRIRRKRSGRQKNAHENQQQQRGGGVRVANENRKPFFMQDFHSTEISEKYQEQPIDVDLPVI